MNFDLFMEARVKNANWTNSLCHLCKLIYETLCVSVTFVVFGTAIEIPFSSENVAPSLLYVCASFSVVHRTSHGRERKFSIEQKQTDEAKQKNLRQSKRNIFECFSLSFVKCKWNALFVIVAVASFVLYKWKLFVHCFFVAKNAK